MLKELTDFKVKGITCNSKKVLDNFIFVAVKGSSANGHDFIKEAIKNGAKAVITQYPIRNTQYAKGVSFIRVKDTRKAVANLAAEFYGNPSLKMKVVGVTGTNGKTTLTYLIEFLLREAGFNPAVIGTINCRFKNKLISSKNTTPGPVELQSMLADMLKAKVDYVIAEVSSHALDQARTEAINFHCAIFTNLSQDHLDYHRTIGEYFRAKAKLFKQPNPHFLAVINRDDKYGRRIEKLTSAEEIITYGIKNKSDISAEKIRFNEKHMEFILRIGRKRIKLGTGLIGYHNVYNILAAVAFALREGIGLSSIKAALKKFSSVPGRLERIPSKKGFWVFVDYAHTQDALRNVLGVLHRISRGRVIIVFGCGGDRDKAKRPKMGYVASQLADYVIITNDNPRSENPLKIIGDIKQGISKHNYRVIPDRRKAIRKAIALAEKDDIVLVAGKGHENYQVLKRKTVHFDDREVVRKCLKSMNY